MTQPPPDGTPGPWQVPGWTPPPGGPAPSGGAPPYGTPAASPPAVEGYGPGYGQGYGPGYGPGYGQGYGQGAPGQQWGALPPGWEAAPPRTGIIPLRPIGLLEIYDGAFRAIRSNPRTMVGVSALVIAATSLVTVVPQAAALAGFNDSALADPERAGTVSATDAVASLSGLFTGLLVPALVQYLAGVVVTGLLVLAVSNAVVGRTTSPGQLWTRSRRRVPGLVGLAVLLLVGGALLITVLLAPGGLVLALTDVVWLGVLLLVGGALTAGLALLALGYGFLALAAPALLLEDLSVVGALRRSVRLVRGSFWRVLGITVLTAVLVGVLAQILSLPFALGSLLVTGFGGGATAGFGETLLSLSVGQVGTILAGAVLYPLTAAVTALLYIDLRMRREGLDVELIRASEEPAGPGPA